MGYYQNFSINRGETFDRYVYIQEESPAGGPQNLTNYTLSGTVQHEYAAAGVYLATFASTVTNGVDGQIRLVLTATETAALPVDRLIYNIYAYAFAGPATINKKVLYGDLNIYPGILTVIPSGTQSGFSPVTIISGVTGYYSLTNGLTVFLNFAELRADVTYYDQKLVGVSYGVTTGDSQGGLFLYLSGISNNDDATSYIKPTAISSGAPGRYRRFI